MRSGALLVIGVVALAIPGCSEPTVPNFNSPTVEAAGSDPSSLQLLATGILSQLRATVTGEDLSTGILGREAFNYTPTEGRNTTHYLSAPNGILDPSGFAVGNFTGPYNNSRNIFNFLDVVANAPLTQAQKDAASGFAKTVEALEFISVVTTRDTIGAVVQVMSNPADLAPFVSLDSAYKYISGRLDEAAAELTSAGATPFPFVLTAGFAGFNTPANFLKVNRAIAARVYAYRGSISANRPSAGISCATCYASALTAIGASFFDPAASALNAGPFHTYSTSTGDAQNTLFFNATGDIMAHPSIRADAPLKADGTRDNRLIAKVDTNTALHNPSPDATNGIPSNMRFRMYPDRNAGIKIITNEELYLLRAEARWFTGDKTGAIADIDFIRASSGGLAASALTVASSDAAFIDELLLQRRYSLLFQGFRWNDLRRFNRLATLPLDRPVHTIAKVMPIPQGECLIRANQTTPAMRGPGCA
ncbi:MAG TPA: RagB/SusD family nutrient uptake outer membrane protein [Gemmatimonadaceae bacterium]|nr:RagB/SusD family nutrient uptake outer membrane protein [Gemmatimonadaceae bacterium]